LPAHSPGEASEDSAREAAHDRGEDNRFLEVVARLGLTMYGVVHLLFAYVATRLVLTDASGSSTGSGALEELAQEGSGRVVLGVVAAGLAALVLWQGITAAMGYRDSRGWIRHTLRFGALARAAVYVYLGYAAASRALSGPAATGGSPDSTSARLMSVPGGQLLLAAIGVTVAGVGVGLAGYGLMRKFLDQLDDDAKKRDRRIPIVLIGQIGYAAKGIAFLVVGGLLCWAAWSHDPDKSGGLDAALVELLGRTAGRPAIVVVAVGIAWFGVYTLIRSRHIQRDSLTSHAAR
jgi:hypothetical protein